MKKKKGRKKIGCIYKSTSYRNGEKYESPYWTIQYWQNGQRVRESSVRPLWGGRRVAQGWIDVSRINVGRC